MSTTTDVIIQELALRGQSLDRLAARHGVLGLTLVGWFEGHGTLPVEVVAELAEALGVSPECLRAMCGRPSLGPFNLTALQGAS